MVSPEGYILTSSHVITNAGDTNSVRPAGHVYVEFADRDRVSAQVVGWDVFDDVGVLKVDPTGELLDEFVHVYTATMTRRNAERRYFFPREFFEAIVRDLQGHFAFIHVLHGGRVISSELVLLSKRHAYFFLGKLASI